MFSNRDFWDDLAIQSYRAILKKKPDSSLVHHNLGLAYIRVNKLNKAIRSFQRALKYDKTRPETYYHLGTTFRIVGKQKEAMRCFANYTKLSKGKKEISTVVPDLMENLERELRQH